MKRLLIVTLLISLVITNGCGLGIMAAGIGYAVSSSKKGDAEAAKAEADLQRSYNEYKLGMERVNIEREKNKLQPQPIMTIQDWLDQQALPERVRKDLAKKKILKTAPETSDSPGSQEAIKSKEDLSDAQ
jgi:hypothetical protein